MATETTTLDDLDLLDVEALEQETSPDEIEREQIVLEELMVPLQMLERDLRRRFERGELTADRAGMRLAVSNYVRLQRQRIITGNQLSAIERAKHEPPALLAWQHRQQVMLEHQVKRYIQAWAPTNPTAGWAIRMTGVGEILAGGIAAYADPDIATNPSKLFRFAGLDPTVRFENGKWMKGDRPSENNRRPYCATLKAICWRLGDSFVKVSKKPNSFYGRIYAEAKAQIMKRNERCHYKGHCDAKLAQKGRISANIAAQYKVGKLPPLVMDLRARRIAIKFFLAHWWEQSQRLERGVKNPPRPWVIAHGGHTNLITAMEAEDYEAGLKTGKFPSFNGGCIHG